MRSPFEKNYGLLFVFYSRKLDLGLYLRAPRHWFRSFWGHAEADVIWYSFGPLDFYRVGYN
jgi:hypothetical protein